MKVKTSYVPYDIPYLTVDKEYEVFKKYMTGEFGGWIIDDAGSELIIAYSGCAHLGGRAWEIVS